MFPSYHLKPRGVQTLQENIGHMRTKYWICDYKLLDLRVRISKHGGYKVCVGAKILYFIPIVWMLDQSSIFLICKFVTFHNKGFEVQYKS